MMEIVEIWQNLKKNATQIMIFLPRYMWAENNELQTHSDEKASRSGPTFFDICYNIIFEFIWSDKY